MNLLKTTDVSLDNFHLTEILKTVIDILYIVEEYFDFYLNRCIRFIFGIVFNNEVNECVALPQVYLFIQYYPVLLTLFSLSVNPIRNLQKADIKNIHFLITLGNGHNKNN